MQLSIKPPTSARVTLRTTVLLLSIVLAVSATFQNALSGPFILDDEASILENESLISLSNLASVLWPRTDLNTAGRPLLNLSFALNYAWGGTVPFGYHVVNVVIHLLAALTLFSLVRRTLLLPRFADRFSDTAIWIAFGTALLWALHPLQTESVTYVSQRAESLMGLCYLGTLYGFIRATERPGGWSLVTVVVCSAGMMVKEVMVTAPVMVFLFDRTFIAGSFKEAWRRRRHMHLGIATTWVVLGALMISTRIHDRGVGYNFGFAWHQYFRIECGAILHYLRLAVVPYPLIFDYGEQVAVPSLAVFTLQAGLLGLIVAGVVVAFWRYRALGFLGCWYFIILAPTSSIVPVAGQPLAENRIYLPLAAVCILAVAGAVTTLGRRAGAVLLAVAVGFGWSTVRRNQDYCSELAIWGDTVGHRPMSWRAHCFYGVALLRIGQLDAAAGHLETAIKIYPFSSYAYLYLASAYLGQKRIDDAIRNYGISLQLKPNNPVALNNLGTAHFQAGRETEALQCYQDALRVRPGFVDAQVNLGLLLDRLGRTTEALAIFEQVVQQHPENNFARESVQKLRALVVRQQSAPTTR